VSILSLRLRLLVPLGALLLLAGGVSPLQAQSDSSFAVARNAVVDITLRTGRLVVRGSAATTGAVRGRSGDYQLRTTGVGVTLDASGDMRSSRTGSGTAGRTAGRRNEATLELDLPRNVRLVVSTSSADVDVSGIDGDVEIRTTSGDISLDDIGGRLTLETLYGDVRLSGRSAAARVTTMSGDITMRGVRDDANVRTTSGDVTLGMDRAARVDVETISGDVTFEGSTTDDARLQLTTHSGDVTLRLPDSARGSLDLSTFNGDITASRSLTLMPNGLTSSRRERAVRRYEIGGGGSTRFTISTFNGDVRVMRGNRS
jgi:predicted membrane protein